MKFNPNIYEVADSYAWDANLNTNLIIELYLPIIFKFDELNRASHI